MLVNKVKKWKPQIKINALPCNGLGTVIEVSPIQNSEHICLQCMGSGMSNYDPNFYEETFENEYYKKIEKL